MANRRKRFARRSLAVLLLLLFLALLFPLSGFLAGVLSGGGRRPDPSDTASGPRELGTLQVTVLRSVDRGPVEGARILVRDRAGGETGATSDAQGRAVVKGVGAGPVRVEARFEGASGSAWTDVGRDGAVELAVTSRPARTGRVLDAKGAPAPATMRLLSANGEELARQRTGPDGTYRFADEARAAAVCAEPDAGAPAVAIDGDLVVAAGRPLAGRLLGAAGGTLVVHALVSHPERDLSLPLRCEWRVDEQGRFSGALPEGTTAWAEYGDLPLRVAAGDVALPARVTARGRVVRRDGSPAANARLTLRPLLDADFPGPLPPRELETGADGTFEGVELAAVAYAITARAPGCATRIVDRVVAATEPLEIVLSEGFALRGVVTDAHGLPVAGAEVRAEGVPDPEDETRPIARTVTDVDGRFVADGLGGEGACVRVVAEGYHPTTVEHTRPAAELHVSLQSR